MKSQDLMLKTFCILFIILGLHFVNCCSPPNAPYERDIFAQCVDTQTCVETNPWFGTIICGFPKKLCNSINIKNYGDGDIST